MGFSVFNCSNCNKKLKKGERIYCDKNNGTECAECRYHAINGTRTIKEYNKWCRIK